MTRLRSYFRLLNSRDSELGRHAERVGAVTEILTSDGLELLVDGGFLTADHLFSPDALEAVVQGALLHELGKVTLEDSILFSKTPLTEEEAFKLRSYPRLGFEVLAEVPSLRPETLRVVLHHQEKWDGSGYPLGLSEWSIPLEAQIVCLADHFVHGAERQASGAVTGNKSAIWMNERSSIYFNPLLVQAFEALHQDIQRAAFDQSSEKAIPDRRMRELS